MIFDEPATGLGAEADSLIARILKSYQGRERASVLMATSEWLAAFSIISALALLIVTLVFIGRGQKWFEKRYLYTGFSIRSRA